MNSLLDRVTTVAAALRTADDFAGAHPLADVLDQWGVINIEIPQQERPRTGPSLELILWLASSSSNAPPLQSASYDILVQSSSNENKFVISPLSP